MQKRKMCEKAGEKRNLFDNERKQHQGYKEDADANFFRPKLVLCERSVTFSFTTINKKGGKQRTTTVSVRSSLSFEILPESPSSS